MFHLLAYRVTGGAADANVDETAVSDGTFTARGGSGGAAHFVLTQPFDLIAAAHLQASALNARLNVPSLNAFVRHNIYPVMRSATIPADPRVQDLRSYGIELPTNEEIAVEESNDAGGAEDVKTFLWISPHGSIRSIPRGIIRTVARFTATIAGVADAWSPFANITFTDSIKGGSWAVVGCQVAVSTLLAFRLNFNRAPMYRGVKLFPGDLGCNAIGNAPSPLGDDWLGEWGRFNSFELPSIQGYTDAAGNISAVGQLDMVYLSSDMGATSQAIG